MSKPKQDPFLPVDKQPLIECMTCDNWKEKRTPEGSIDYAAGKCPAKGLSHCPARHVCSDWRKRRKTRKEDEE